MAAKLKRAFERSRIGQSRKSSSSFDFILFEDGNDETRKL